MRHSFKITEVVLWLGYSFITWNDAEVCSFIGLLESKQ